MARKSSMKLDSQASRAVLSDFQKHGVLCSLETIVLGLLHFKKWGWVCFDLGKILPGISEPSYLNLQSWLKEAALNLHHNKKSKTVLYCHKFH